MTLLPAGQAWAGVDSEISSLLNKQNLGQAEYSIYLVDLTTGDDLVKIHPDLPLMPASNMKVVTTAAALNLLGPDFVFRTELRMIQPAEWINLLPEDQKQFQAHLPTLLVHGSGDPSFGDEKILGEHGKNVEWLLDLWVQAVVRTGVKQFGSLMIDDATFDQEWIHPNWPTDQLDRWYCAEVTGLNFHENCLNVFLQPTQMGMAPSVDFAPSLPIITVTNRALTGRSDTFSVGRVTGNNEIVVRGEIKNRRTEPVQVTIHDPPLFFGRVLADRLRQAGIGVQDVIRAPLDRTLPAGATLHALQTTMPLILDRCNQDSHNLYAESLLKRMGQKLTGSPGSWNNGAAAVRSFLTSRLGASAAVVHVDDGSGMSRENRVTARVLVELLADLYGDPQLGPIYLHSMAVAGNSGTLEKRLNPGADMPALVVAKSGYIRAVTALTGYMLVPTDPAVIPTSSTTPDFNGYRVIAFSMLFNNYKPPVHHYMIKDLEDQVLRLVARRLFPQIQNQAQQSQPHLGG
ncbi:MAG: D-alanyl-D-alanine carboxypeptidase/D-alanyl-D-alanine-endopeptidase [Phycisphaeraceae bacterium]|nr:D-alanyl-D-alanine carboxypeptidase/D-alanyl-D-alanine-endopeptidase [Phycisphaeraceae bacterium]